MSLKEKIQGKIEKNAVKSEIGGEEVILRKGSIFSWIPILGEYMKEWHQIYPAINEDGSYNIPNILFGGWRNLIKLVFILLIIGMFFYGFYQYTEGARELASNECLEPCMQQCAQQQAQRNIIDIENTLDDSIRNQLEPSESNIRGLGG